MPVLTARCHHCRMANSTKRDERNSAPAKTVAKAIMPTPAVWPGREVCSICGAPADIGMYKHTGATVYYCAKHPPDGDAFEVNKFAGVKFYCEADLPTDTL